VGAGEVVLVEDVVGAVALTEDDMVQVVVVEYILD
jgi:hypothetical protein